MLYLEMVPPTRQKSWQWPVVANFVFGGTGAGLFLLSVLFVQIEPTWISSSQYISPRILSPLFVSLGFFCVFLEAGKPWRGYRLLNSLTHSWMSIESLFGGLFILSSVTSYLFGSFLVDSIAVFSAVIFLISQGFMVATSVAVRAWNEKWVLPVIAGSGFMAAAGVMLLNSKHVFDYDYFMSSIVLVIIVLNLIAWLIYLFGKFESDYKIAVRNLRNPIFLLLVVGVGHIFPFFLLCFIFAGYVEPFSWSSAILSFSTGLMLVTGGICQKIGMIIAAGYYRSIVLKDESI